MKTNYHKSFKTLFFFIVILLTPFSLLAQNNYLYLSHNYRIHPSDITQTEVFITKSPINENILFSSCNTLSFIPFFVSEGIYTSEDEGITWHGKDSCTGEPVSFHGGDPGIAIDKDGRFVLTRLGRSPFIGLYSHFSYDNGKSWTAQKTISNDDLERASVITDAISSSSFYGHTYATWVNFAPPYPVMFSTVSSENENWSNPIQINNPTNRNAGGDVAVGPYGNIFSCWAGITESSPFKEIYVGIASSTDGGDAWDVTENAFEVDGITGILPNKGNIRVNGLPSIDIDNTNGDRRGWIYIVTGQQNLAPAGSDPDIILNRSIDGGITWSNGIRVNQDDLNNGKTQYFPTVHVDIYGAANIIFYDDRNTSIDSTGVFLARSIDGGNTWKEYEISDHNFKPEPIGGLGQGYQGDNIDITSTNNNLWPVWMDNSTGNYQIWTTQISFSDLDFLNDETVEFPLLEQNYPNPFSSETTIGYRVKKKSYVTITITNMLGVRIASMVNETKQPGYYELTFFANEYGLKSGEYFYCLKTNNQAYSKTMTLAD